MGHLPKPDHPVMIVQSDDLGMCHAVNAGIVRGFREGILTQSSIMAPCPWFAEGVDLALTHDLPVGVHLTGTCEWDRYRWRPLTDGPSLVQADMGMHPDVPTAKQHAKPEELEAEFDAQVQRIRNHGVEPVYVDMHMNLINFDVYVRVTERHGLISRRREPLPDDNFRFRFDSYLLLSEVDCQTKRDRFFEHIEQLSPGYHFVGVHLAEDHPELNSLCSMESPVRSWARDRRVSDTAVIVDPESRKLCQRKGVELAALRDILNKGESPHNGLRLPP